MNMNITDHEFNKNLISLLRVMVPSKLPTIGGVQASNLVNFGIILLDENTNNLLTGDIDEDIAKEICNRFGTSNGVFNKHFHRTWAKIADADLDTLVLEQLIHYFSTYGLEALVGQAAPMLPAEKFVPEYMMANVPNKFTVIRVVSYETAKELFEQKITAVQKPNIVETRMINDILEYYNNQGDYPKINTKDIPSFEVMCMYCMIGGITPSDPQTFLRCVIYLATGSTLIIKNKKTIDEIKRSMSYNLKSYDKILEMFANADLKSLSTIFLRYKPLFLAFKASNELKPTINKIRRLARTNHRPLPDVTVANATKLVKENRLPDVANLINKMSLRNVIKLYNYSLNASSDCTDVIYNIRSGKTFTTDRAIDKKSADTLKGMCMGSIIAKLDQRFKGKKFYIPKTVHYKVPVSEKQMIGSIPYGTTIEPEEKGDTLCISIAWENFEGHRTDIDLHLQSVNGCFGWNSNYRSDDTGNSRFTRDEVLYSGDMTDATNGATETMRVNANSENLFLADVNLYSGSEKCPFKVFLSAGEDFRDRTSGMVDISKALTTPIQLDFREGRSLSFGYMYKGTFTFYGGTLGRGRIPSQQLYLKALNAIMNRTRNMLSLNDLIMFGGGTIVTEPEEDAVDLSPETVLSQSFFELID